MTHRHDGVPCCWDCFASKPTHLGPAEDCPGWLICGRMVRLVKAPAQVRITLAWASVGPNVYDQSRLCAPCLASGVAAPADDAPIEPVCRSHLAEDRINEMLRAGTIKGWWT